MLLKTNTNYYFDSKKIEQLVEEINNSLAKYFESKSYPIEVIEEIVNENFIATNPKYYLYYPYLFNNYFHFDDKEILNLLSISGFLYYRAVILIDDIFDNKDISGNFQKFFIANICQEETIKILSSFFSANSDFWKTWNIRKFEYAKAYKLDKTLKSIKGFSEFEALADYKSAFGKIAIDCLYHLSERKNKPLYITLLESHKYFYAGFQIMDDIIDYSEDVKNGQFNISRQELVNSLIKENDNIDNYSLEDQKKLIYVKGVAENLYIKATKYLNESSKIQIDFINNDTHLWSNEIDNLYNTGVTHLLNIKGFIDVYNAKKRLSHNIKSQSTLNQAIKNAVNYLESNQLLDGNWNDILNDAGISDVWTTSYVVYSLNELKAIIPISILDNAIDYIIKCQLSNGLWGYNKVWVDDADSSSFALLSLKGKNHLTKGSISEWLKFQNKDGGFTTYSDENILLSSLNNSYIQNVDGWLQSHFCVSAVAYLVFIELKITSKNSFESLRSYLISKLKSNDEALSYWWSEDIYAFYYIFLGAVLSNDKQIINICKTRIKGIIKQKSLNYFFKGILLKTLCLTDALFNEYSMEIRDLVNQISSSQYADGSWQESYSLRMPHPSVLNANNKNIVWKEGNKGTNIIVKDHNRIFTTVSCLTALKSYGDRIS